MCKMVIKFKCVYINIFRQIFLLKTNRNAIFYLGFKIWLCQDTTKQKMRMMCLPVVFKVCTEPLAVYWRRKRWILLTGYTNVYGELTFYAKINNNSPQGILNSRHGWIQKFKVIRIRYCLGVLSFPFVLFTESVPLW